MEPESAVITEEVNAQLERSAGQIGPLCPLDLVNYPQDALLFGDSIANDLQRCGFAGPPESVARRRGDFVQFAGPLVVARQAAVIYEFALLFLSQRRRHAQDRQIKS